MRSACPNGVSMESKATVPTTRTGASEGPVAWGMWGARLREGVPARKIAAAVGAVPPPCETERFPQETHGEATTQQGHGTPCPCGANGNRYVRPGPRSGASVADLADPVVGRLDDDAGESRLHGVRDHL